MSVSIVPMPYGDIISVSQAMKIAGVSDETIRRWCKKYGIGRRYRAHSWADDKWQVSLPGLRMVIARDWDALEAFRDGDRTSDLVARHLHRVDAPERGTVWDGVGSDSVSAETGLASLP